MVAGKGGLLAYLEGARTLNALQNEDTKALRHHKTFKPEDTTENIKCNLQIIWVTEPHRQFAIFSVKELVSSSGRTKLTQTKSSVFCFSSVLLGRAELV